MQSLSIAKVANTRTATSKAMVWVFILEVNKNVNNQSALSRETSAADCAGVQSFPFYVVLNDRTMAFSI